jgi:hypothetical protein
VPELLVVLNEQHIKDILTAGDSSMNTVHDGPAGARSVLLGVLGEEVQLVLQASNAILGDGVVSRSIRTQ